VATLQLDLFRTAQASVQVRMARRNALPVVLAPSANRRRFSSDRIPVRRGFNRVYLVFLQPDGPLEPLLIESLTVRAAVPGFAPPPADPPAAPLAPATRALVQQLEQARAEQRWEDVVRLGEQVTRQAPEHGPSWLMRGDALRRLERHDARCGIEVLDEAVRRLPASPWTWHDTGCAFLCGNWLGEASHYLAYAARMAPQEFWMWYDLALVQQRRGRFAAALAQLDRAGACPGADHGMIARLRAEVLLEVRDRQGALEALGRALARDPTDSETRRSLAALQGAGALAGRRDASLAPRQEDHRKQGRRLHEAGAASPERSF
jgi:predicted Zn-dependent protease